MATKNSRGYIHIYFGLFDHNVWFGSHAKRQMIGEALLQFVDFDFKSINGRDGYHTLDFADAHPYFTGCSKAWQDAFENCLNTHEVNKMVPDINELEAIQSRYRSILDGLYRHGGSVDTKKITELMAQNQWLAHTSCFCNLTLQPDGKIDYFVSSFEECLMVELLELLKRKIVLKPCKNCGRLFAPKRSNMDYCTRIASSDGKSCAEVGYNHTFANNVKNDELLLAYTRAYKAHYARMTKPRKKSANMTREAFESWYQEAKRKLEQARAGELDAEIFKTWLKQ